MNPIVLHVLLALSWILIAGTICLIRNNNGLIDIFWGLGFAWISLWTISSLQPRFTANYVINALIWIWAMRLSGYLFLRNWRKPEDFRYADFRKKWSGSWVLNSIIKVYLVQGLLLALIAAPIAVLNSQNKLEFSLSVVVGMIISFLGLAIEAVSDFQKNRFKKVPENKNKICKAGLWKYSRHPNYLGEILMWWGIALSTSQVHFGYIAFVSAGLITFLLYKVSGIPFLEEKKKDDPEFQKYKSSTGAIFPKFF